MADRQQESLSQFVLRRNGVPLGAKGSLTHNLRNAFGAGSNADFWRYWNPIWGYYLLRNVYVPLGRWLPSQVASLVTFLVSGAVHDLAIGLLGFGWQLFLTLTFIVFGLVQVGSKATNFRYDALGFPLRVLVNLTTLGACIALSAWLMSLF